MQPGVNGTIGKVVDMPSSGGVVVEVDGERLDVGKATWEKVRYEITVGKHLWEVDEFYGKHAGLMLAEIELTAEDELFERPEWVTLEVSEDVNYFNSNLIQR